jgi:hypothetical protein
MVVSINLVPGCVVTAPVDVFDVIVFFPNEALLDFPITPPFAEPDLFLGI